MECLNPLPLIVTGHRASEGITKLSWELVSRGVGLLENLTELGSSGDFEGWLQLHHATVAVRAWMPHGVALQQHEKCQRVIWGGGKSHRGGVSRKAEPSTIGGSSWRGEREYGLRDYCGALYINSISIHFTIKIQGA